jgi:broad specificity phosphatase PhoE
MEGGMMRQVILVKHASPMVVPGKSSDQWPLSSAGKEAAGRLVDKLTGYGATAVVSSTEPKAAETARIVAEGLDLPAETYAGLHEHERRTVPHLKTSDFLSLMAQVFRRKEEVVLGEESAAAALTRFRKALEGVCARHAEGNLIIVAHGTVIALFLEVIGGVEGYKVWREMGLPSYAVVETPEWRVMEIVAKVEEGKAENRK